MSLYIDSKGDELSFSIVSKPLKTKPKVVSIVDIALDKTSYTTV